MQEIWKDIAGYEGLYQVSNFGRVKSVDRFILDSTDRKQFKKGKLLAQRKRRKNADYLSVDLWKDNTIVSCAVHRLVAEAFMPNPSKKSQVNHIDEKPENNRLDNLEWVTPQENMNHGSAQGKINGRKKKRIQGYDKHGNLLFTFSSFAEAGRNGFSASAISQNVSGRTKTSGGYIWRIAE